MAGGGGEEKGGVLVRLIWALTRHRALFAFALLILASTWHLSRIARGSGKRPSPLRAEGARGGARARAPPTLTVPRPRAPGGGESSSCSDDGRPSMVWVVLGDPFFQPYLLESVAQARIFNPDECFFVVVDPRFFKWDHAWVPRLDELGVLRVNYTVLTAPYVHDFSMAYERLWDELGRILGSMMQPTINGRSNMEFTMVTMVRLVAVHQLMHLFGIERVVHVENDQMTYGPIVNVQKGADFCGVRLAMTKVGIRLAPATVYARDATALKDMLDFILDAITHGVERAQLISGDPWVTDMSLPAAYFDAAAAAGSSSIVKFPNANDGSCLANRTGFIFDGLGLGIWCCGSFEWPRKRLATKLLESNVAYWEQPFEWRVINDLRMPFWNYTPVFNLHMHSKQLHLFRSGDLDVAHEAFDAVPIHN